MDITLILHDSEKRKSGGPQVVAYDTVEGLKKNHRRLEKEDIFFHILSTTGTTLRSVSANDDTYSNISVEYFRELVPTALLSDVNYLLRIKSRNKKTDLIHSHSISGAFVGTLLKIPTMFTLHGMMWKEKLYFQGYPRFAYEVNIRRFNYFSRRLKKLIAISPYVVSEVDHYLKTGVPDTEVIENPISDIFFEQEKRENGGSIVYPGSINCRKNQIGLMKALDLLKKDNIRFHCVLPGPILEREYFRELQKTIKKFDLEQEVTVPGPVPFEHLLRLYSEAGIMVMTTLQETAPMVISEAMAMGIPVIAPPVSGIPYMVSPGKTGFLINPQSTEELASHMAMLLDDAALRKKFSDESRKIAASRWRSDVITNKLLDLYVKERSSLS
jgi:glycosyltransferase involved in cell wall biosynthesis